MNSEEAADALLHGMKGVIDVGETWGGRVKVEDDVVVAEGATLRIAAGTQVVFAAPLPGSGKPPTALIIFGRLSVEGSEARPVSLAGPGGWGGITVMPGGRAHLNHARLENAEAGLALRGGAIRLESCRVERCRGGMILADGSGEFTDLTLDECQEHGVYAAAGRHRFTRYRGPAIVFEEQARVEFDGRPLSAARPGSSQEDSSILRLVLRTQDTGGFREIYRALYSLGELSFRALSGLSGNVASCDVWRGVKRGDWRAGISDLDFIVVARDLAGMPGKQWLEGFWKRHALMKRAAPFLGETLVALEPELREFLEHGGARAPELAVAVRRAPPPPFSEPKRLIASWTECAHSYGRLLEWLWLRDDYPWDFRRVQIFKSAVDVLRHLPSAGTGREKIHLSRKVFWENILETPFAESRGVLNFLLEQHPPRGRDDASLAGIWAHVLRAMHRGAPEEEAWSFPEEGTKDFVFVPAPPSKPAGEYGATLERWNPQLRRFRDQFGEGLSGALFSDLYPSYAILEDAEIAKPGLASALARWAAAPPSGGLTFLLSRRLWRLWSRLPFAENPLQFMDASTARAGRLVPVRSQFAWGDLSVPRPSPAVLSESARQAWAQMRLSRRWLGSPMAAVNGRYAAHYLLSRSMGLRLLTQRRIAAPFFDLDHLTKVYLREFPDDARALASIAPESGARSVDESYWACHDFLEPALAEPKR